MITTGFWGINYIIVIAGTNNGALLVPLPKLFVFIPKLSQVCIRHRSSRMLSPRKAPWRYPPGLLSFRVEALGFRV